MKKFAFTMAFAVSLLLAAGCANEPAYDDAANIPATMRSNVEFTAEMMHELGKVSAPKLSPDGNLLLYGVSYTNVKENKSLRHLFIMNLDGTESHQLTHFDKSVSNECWIDNGKKIAYLQGGQIFVMNADGTKPQQVSSFENGISEFTFSPDEKKLIYVAEFKNYTAPTDKYGDLDKANVRTIDNLMYRHWDHYVENIPHTYVASFDGQKVGEGVDILDGAPFELPTEPFSGIEQLSWSPDGNHIAYSCRKLTGVEYAFSTNTDIYLYDVNTKECKNLTEGMPGYDTDPVYSPDGKKLAWLSMERAGFESDKARLFVIDLASGEKKDLTANFKYNAESPLWSDDSNSLYFASLVEGVKEIWKSTLNAEFTRITPEHEWFDFASPVAVVGNQLITTNTSMMRPAEIVTVSLADNSWHQLTHENDATIAELSDITCEERWITTTDNKKMLTWVLYPPEFNPEIKYPAILVCLGGPQGTLSQGWSTRWNYRLMAAQGYIVVLPNRRGTTAFGQAWTDQISGDYAGQNIKDYLSAADDLLEENYVSSMAAVGASYGGYSVYYLAGVHEGRFSAFIAHAGIFNLEHMYMETEEMWFPNWDNGGIADPSTPQSGAPWSNNPVAKKHYSKSPHLLVKNWDTPIMVIHGEKDYRVPYDQGMAAFNAAQMMGVPSKMLLFPDENHWILKPQNSIYWNREFFAWLDQWCK